MNHLKLTITFVIKRLFRNFFPIIFSIIPTLSFCQKDCNHTNTGLVPLTDLGGQYYRGFQGGLYENGTNNKSQIHQSDLKFAAGNIKVLDTAGNIASNGKIVMIGVGASNPRTEFDEFTKKAQPFGNLNPNLTFANTCIGGQGVQKMNDPTDNYWKQATNTLDSLGLGAKQVQIAWIETENTQSSDTVFPRAPLALVNDLNQLLKTLLIKFPNLKICYFSPRAYSGFATPVSGGVGKGLLFPRDYYNGWAGKWLIQNIIDRTIGFEFNGANKVIPLCTFGSYHWSDGSKKRNDSFYLDCNTEVGDDGLHLSELGEIKVANQMFDFFANDTLAQQWFLSKPATAVNFVKDDKQFSVYPNPIYDNKITINLKSIFTNKNVVVRLIDYSGKTIFKSTEILNNSILNIDLPSLVSGIYWLDIQIDNEIIGIEKLVVL